MEAAILGVFELLLDMKITNIQKNTINSPYTCSLPAMLKANHIEIVLNMFQGITFLCVYMFVYIYIYI